MDWRIKKIKRYYFRILCSKYTSLLLRYNIRNFREPTKYGVVIVIFIFFLIIIM